MATLYDVFVMETETSERALIAAAVSLTAPGLLATLAERDASGETAPICAYPTGVAPEKATEAWTWVGGWEAMEL